MSTIDRVINAASRVGGAIRSVTTLGGLVGREHGGPVAAGQPVIVGERRPELFVPHTSGTILPRITGASGGGGVGITVNLVINGDINGFDDFQQKVTSVIRDAVLGGGFSGVLARA
jgi:phage-related minor tail protein